MSGLRLADLFDLEIRTLEEKGENEEVRRSRYRNLGRRVLDRGTPPDGGALLQAMLRLDTGPGTPGARFETAVGWFQTLLAVAGMICGVSLSLGLLHVGGPHPVNILNVLAVLVGTQLVLLLFLIAALIPRERGRFPGPVQGLLRMGLRKLAGVERLEALEERLDSHRGLLRWLMIRAAQLFGVFFNVAAIAACLYRITFSDVAFGWSTTLQLDAAAFHRIAETLAAPWAWAFPDAVPGRTLVEMTQYSHLEGKYILRGAGERSANPSIVGGWWPFLLLSLATYGFLPRLLLAFVSSLRVGAILKETPDRNEEFRRLADWMRLPLVTTQSDGTPILPPVVPAGSSGDDPALPPPGASCELLLDGAPKVGRDVVERLVKERFGWTISSGGPLVIVLSAWEEPTRGNQRLFQNLPADRLIVVGLLNPSSNGDPRLEKIRERWKRHLHGRNLRLRVESL